MKIGLVVDDGLDRLDGVQKYTVTIGEHFRSLGHEVHYLAGQTLRKDISNIHSLSKNLRVVFNGGNQLSIPLPASRRKLKNLLNKEMFDVIHVQTPYSPFMAGRIIKYAPKSTAIVGTFHILPYGFISFWGSWILGTMQRFTLRKFDTFFSVSIPAQEFANKTFGIESRVIPNPVDTAIYKPTESQKPNKNLNIVYLGRLVKRKGCQQLLKAIYEITKNGQNEKELNVHILSDGALRPKLERYTQSHGLDEIVKFHGYTDESEKVKLLQKADIAVFPSISGESFGIVLVEAMAAGAGVVLAGDNPGYRSVINDDDVLFNPRDITQLADMLEGFINDDAYRHAKHTEQQHNLAKYDLESVGNEILKQYKICKSRHPQT